MTERITEPGYYPDIAEEDYHRDPVAGGSLSSTGARRLLPPSCPATFKYERDHGRPEKRAFDFGHLAHAVVLGKGADLVVIDADNYQTKAARAARDEAYAARKTPVLRHELPAAHEMAAKVREHPDAGPLLDPRAGRAEVTLVYRDPETGVMCRVRIDFLHDAWPGQPVKIVDYKTTDHCGPESVSKSVANFGYLQQAPFYSDALAELGLDGGLEPEFWFVFQEKNAPYLITVGRLDAEAIAWGRIRNRKARDIYRRCLETDTWPSYTDEPIEISLPGWKVREFDAAWQAGAYDILPTETEDVA